jgi:hypothetical protein
VGYSASFSNGASASGSSDGTYNVYTIYSSGTVTFI